MNTKNLPIVINKKDRTPLFEGRNQGLGFAFAKRTGENEFTAVMPLSPCKDYLNDVVYVETTGKKYSIFGLTYEKQDVFDDPNYAFLLMSILPAKLGTELKPYPDMEKDVKKLHDHHVYMELLMRGVDRKFKIPTLWRTKILRTQTENLFLVLVPKIYTHYTYGISLYTLLLRVGLNWDKSKSAHEFMTSFNSGADGSMWVGVKNKFDRLVEKGWVEQDFSRMSPHGLGIMSVVFKD